MRTLFLKLSLITLAVALPLAAADVFLGVWKADMAKSKYNPGPAPKSITATYSADGDWITLKNETVAADGKASSSTNRYKRDGKDYPWTGQAVPGANTISVKLVDDHHTIATLKKGAAVLSTSKVSISKDGKTRTMVSEGTNADGKKFSNTIVSTRQ